MAGFGKASSSSSSTTTTTTKKKKNKKKKTKSKPTGSTASKIKPKSQWDRYINLKQSQAVRVAVRRVLDDNEKGEEDNEGGVVEWMEVGCVKSKNNLYTKLAIFKQRALIAEHAKRLFPLKILPKDRVEWGYYNEDINDWTAISSSTSLNSIDDDDNDSVNDNIEKQIGFEGIPDPNTGYYCHYKEGRLVDKE